MLVPISLQPQELAPSMFSCSTSRIDHFIIICRTQKYISIFPVVLFFFHFLLYLCVFAVILRCGFTLYWHFVLAKKFNTCCRQYIIHFLFYFGICLYASSQWTWTYLDDINVSACVPWEISGFFFCFVFLYKSAFLIRLVLRIYEVHCNGNKDGTENNSNSNFFFCNKISDCLVFAFYCTKKKWYY